VNAYGSSPWLQRHWDARAAANFIGGGLGAGLLLASAVARTVGSPWQLALLAGVAAMGIGLFCVWLEIGRPLRAMNVFINSRTSAMSRESVAAVAAFSIAAVALVTGLLWAAWLTGVAALAFVWCQARMLQAARGIPAWRHPAIVPLIVGSAAADGAALYAVLQLPQWLAGAAHPGGALVTSLLLLVIARWALWQRYRLQLDASASAPLRAALGRIAVVQSVATLAAVAMLVSALAWAAAAPVLAALGGVTAAGAGAWMRFALIRRAAYNQGFSLPKLPVRGVARTAATVREPAR
jgi:phenylacetyl-CoA:acceptor oxidoreductase 26-kDa subunit